MHERVRTTSLEQSLADTDGPEYQLHRKLDERGEGDDRQQRGRVDVVPREAGRGARADPRRRTGTPIRITVTIGALVAVVVALVVALAVTGVSIAIGLVGRLGERDATLLLLLVAVTRYAPMRGRPRGPAGADRRRPRAAARAGERGRGGAQARRRAGRGVRARRRHDLGDPRQPGPARSARCRSGTATRRSACSSCPPAGCGRCCRGVTRRCCSTWSGRPRWRCAAPGSPRTSSTRAGPAGRAAALTNTAKHAGARRAEVRLVGGPGALLVEVCDDGSGIDPEVAAGVGLRSIRERAEELGGRTEISCPSAGGTRVRAWLPRTPGLGEES